MGLLTVGKHFLVGGILVVGAPVQPALGDPAVPQDVARDFGDAVWNGDADSVARLLGAGANPDSAGSAAGLTFPPIVAAARLGCGKVVELLLQGHADPNARDSQGYIGRARAAHLCAQSIEDTSDPVSTAIPTTETVGHSALIEAADAGFPDVVSELITAKASLNATDPEGKTALIHAAALGHLEVVRRLVAAGADVSIATSDGSALESAAFEGSPDSVALLLTAGANPRRKFGAAHKTAIDIAKAFGNKAAAQVMQTGHLADRWHRDFSLLDLGESPRALRQELLQSLVFRNAALLTIPAVDGNAMGISDDMVHALQNEVAGLATLLLPLVSKRGPLISKMLHVSLHDLRTTTFNVADSPEAGAFSELVPELTGGGHPDVTITAKLIRANVQASINEGIPAIARWEPLRQSASLQETRRDIENFAFLNIVNVQSSRVGSATLALGDAAAAGPYTELVNISQKIRPVESRYYGTLMFVIAHELGHIALGHLETPVPCHRRELEADAFAAYLLGTTLLGMSASPLPIAFGDAVRPSGRATLVEINDDAYLRYTGSALFFTQAYELAHFPASSQSCLYPSPQERADLTGALLSRIKNEEAEAVIDRLERLANLGPGLGVDAVTRLRQMVPD